jgi:hypothetical protein
MRYRIKLYGHTTSDPEAFCKNLAAVLNIGIEDALGLLRQAPVPIAEGIDEKEAERLESRLSAIHALSLVEPTAEDSPYEESFPTEIPAPSGVPVSLPFRLSKDETFRWLAWSGVLAVVVGISVLFLVASFTSTYLQLDRKQTKTSSQEKKASEIAPNPSEEQLSAEKAQLADDILARIDSLEREIPELQAKLRKVMTDIDFPERRSIMLDLQKEIRSHRSELHGLKHKLQGLVGVGEVEWSYESDSQK